MSTWLPLIMGGMALAAVLVLGILVVGRKREPRLYELGPQTILG